MKNSRLVLFIIVCALLFCDIYPINSVTALEPANGPVEELEKRLRSLEPTDPKQLKDPPWEELPFPSSELPISHIITKGKKINFEVIVNKPKYQRPAYEEIWHSTIGRWSYIPTRIHYALHRLFTNYDIGLSNWYDFEHNMGFGIPMFQNEKALDLYIVVFQSKVIEVYTKGNQVVVASIPERNGVQVITVKTGDIEPANKEEALLVQLATRAGDEIDHSLISYVPPDFWLKQKEKLKKSKH